MVNLLAFTTYHSFLSVFMMNTTPTGAKKSIAKVQNQKVSQNVFLLSCFFFFFSSSSGGLVQNSWLFHNDFHTKQQHVTFTSPSLFHNFEVWQSGFISDAIFKDQPMCKNHWATKQWLLIRNMVVCMKTGRVFGIHCWLSVWRAWSTILQPILHTSTQETYDDRLAALQ